MIARLKAWAALAGLVVAALVASWFGGRNSAKTDIKAKELEDYVDTRKKMDDVVVGDDPAAARRWLRERGQRPGDM